MLFNERLNISIAQHLQSLETLFKRYFPELKEQVATFVRNPFSIVSDVSDIPDELQDQFYDHQNLSSARDFFRKWHSLSSNVLCANPSDKYPSCLFEYCFLFLQYTMSLRERLFSSCLYQKRKRKIEKKLNMILDWVYQALNHESLN